MNLHEQLSMAEKCDYDKVVLENYRLKEKSYLRISKRFPHLTMKETIEFDKKVRENGGSIKAHGGVYLKDGLVVLILQIILVVIENHVTYVNNLLYFIYNQKTFKILS